MTHHRNHLKQNAALMAAWLSGRLQFFTQPAALPLVLLLLAMATVFLLGNDRGHFYRGGAHDWNSSQSLAFAENLSFQHGLLAFHYQSLDKDGNHYYKGLYNRFPKGGYALIKLAILPFGDNFGAKIYAARVLMLLLFTAAATLAYLALARLVGSGWVALTATALAFSSYYILYYSDKISNEVTIDLFAVMLAFHGMVVFVQEGRFRQLLVKACLALLLGWHVYAFLLPFIIFGLAGELFQARAGIMPSPGLTSQIRQWGTALLSSRYLVLGVVALLVGVAILAFNFAGEYFALDGKVPLRQLPSVESAMYRLGTDAEFNDEYAEHLAWGAFLENQFYRMGQMLYPFLLSPFDNSWGVDKARDSLAVAAGALALTVCYIGLVFAPIKHKMLLATLAISGFCWALPLRNSVAFHDFETVFYVGIPLVFFALITLYLRKLSSRQSIAAVAVAALLLFVLSAAEMARIGHDDGEAAADAEMVQDFKVIRAIVGEGSVVSAPLEAKPWSSQADQFGGAPWAMPYFLAGNVIIYENIRGDGNLVNFLIERHREDSPALLTPGNRRVFLYDRAIYDGQYDEATLGSPLITSDWNVYLKDGSLIYTGEECANTDTPFFLHIVPLDVNDLPERSKEYGFDNLDFGFGDFVVRSGAPCVAARELPGYDIAAIRTGQYTEDGQLWQGEYHFER